MANPIPSTALPATADVDEILLELIPITCPSILTRAPPELPGLMAASVCKRLLIQFHHYVLHRYSTAKARNDSFCY